MIEVTDLQFGYARPDEVYRGITWSAEAGEAWVLLGPSGCGKTTLVYLLAGLRRASSGSVRVDGAEVDAPRTTTGLILQDHGLLPWAKARENVGLGLKLRGVPKAEREEKVRYWLERLGISAVAEKYPGQLSGGQRQRVAIARTLALDPTLLLMDEPFSSLDSSTREDLQELVAGLSHGGEMTTLLVTHDIQEAVFMGRRIMVVGHAPIDGYAVLENPEARQPGYRQSPAFFARCAELRRLVGAKEWKDKKEGDLNHRGTESTEDSRGDAEARRGREGGRVSGMSPAVPGRRDSRAPGEGGAPGVGGDGRDARAPGGGSTQSSVLSPQSRLGER